MKKTVVFSGAGMSAESGITTFRDSNGLWENHNVHDVATPDAWRSNPSLVQEFYNVRRKNIIDAQPNKAHKIIAELENNFQVSVITQNIDDLHERAGSTKVYHLHGNIRFSKSSGPNQEMKYYPIQGDRLDLGKDLCPDGYPLRPHVVWFGESVPMYEVVIPIIASADVLIVIGTSLNVYPAAGLIHHCSDNCEKFLIDPNAKQLSVPSSYHVIEENAIAGMTKLLEILTAM